MSDRALRVALDYYTAWTSHDLDRAMTFLADDLVCEAPAGRLEGAAAFRAFMAPFVDMLVRAELLGAYGDDEHALIAYDTETKLVASGPAAEYVTVRDGRIVHSRFIFDRLPFAQARG
jgi:ketosteroid isomerase-like protein